MSKKNLFDDDSSEGGLFGSSSKQHYNQHSPGAHDIQAAVEAYSTSEEARDRVTPNVMVVPFAQTTKRASSSSDDLGSVQADVEACSASIIDPTNESLRSYVLSLSKEKVEAVATYPCEGNYTVLHVAARLGDEYFVSLLLSHGAKDFVDLLDEPAGQGQDRFSPLIYAVDTCNSKNIQALLRHSQHPEDALCAAIQFYKTSDPDDKEIRQETLEWLLTLPEIKGKPNDSHNVCSINRPAQSIPTSGFSERLTALQCLSAHRDKHYYEQLILLWSQNRSSLQESLIAHTSKQDTFFHLAIRGIDPENEAHIQFVQYLMEHHPNLVNNYNAKGETALSLASKQGALPVIKILAPKLLPSQNKEIARLFPPLSARRVRSVNQSPLHEAISDSASEVVKVLLETFTDEVNSFLDDSTQCESLRKLAVDKWHAQVLNKQDATQQTKVLAELLTLDSKGRIIKQQFDLAEKALSTITDQHLQLSLSKMFSKVQSDYSLISYKSDKEATEQKVKALCLASSIYKVAQSFALQGDSHSAAKEQARNEFELCVKPLLYSNRIKTLVGIAICALIGMVVGAVIGFIVGELISGGMGGGLVLGPQTAQYGWAVGTIVGCGIFGLGFGATRYLTSDLFKSWFSLWSISRAMKQNIQPEKSNASSASNNLSVKSGEEARLIEAVSVEEGSEQGRSKNFFE